MLNADLKEFVFTSDYDELVVSAVLAVPSGDINGIVQVIHGMNEHKERYYPFMDYLAEQGFITIISDNRGHGKSMIPRHLSNWSTKKTLIIHPITRPRHQED